MNQAENLRDVSAGRNRRKFKVLTITSEKVANNQQWQWPKKKTIGDEEAVASPSRKKRHCPGLQSCVNTDNKYCDC